MSAAAVCRKGHPTDAAYLWECSGCERTFCLDDGAADDQPDLCDECWALGHAVIDAITISLVPGAEVRA